MHSLPPQHIDSLPKALREQAYKQIAGLWFARMQDVDSEEELATKAGFPSVEAMHANLQNWGLGGMLPARTMSKPVRKSRAPNVQGGAQELPSLKDAATTFRDTIRTLEDYLEQVTTLKETLRGDYFIGEGETEESNIREVRGAQWHPHPYVVILVATSILEHHGNWGFVERLLNELHLKPTEANRQQLVRYIYGRAVDENGRPKRNKDGKWKREGDGLLDRAKQIAALIRGAPKVRTGQKPSPITSLDQYEAWRIKQLIGQGLSQDEVERRAREEFEHSKMRVQQNILEELELAKRTLSEEEFTRESRVAHEGLQEVSNETFDRDSFIRRYKLAWDSE